jgi:pseudaminic acid biosynthesis-associated methylase
MDEYRTEQEGFWAGNFGDEYTDRNRGDRWVASNTALFAKVLKSTGPIRSVIEFGANAGLNLRAIRGLLPDAELSAVEINKKAVDELARIGNVNIYHGSILDYSPAREHDLVLIKGVLIHLNPEVLPQVYDLLHRASGRYICIAEYYNPTPVEISYRGHKERLFKRDFAGEILGRFKDLRLADYGFAYHLDPNFPQDDINWFLLEKPAASGNLT